MKNKAERAEEINRRTRRGLLYTLRAPERLTERPPDGIRPSGSTEDLSLIQRLLVSRGWLHGPHRGAIIWLCPTSGHWFSETAAIARSQARQEAGMDG